RVRQLFEEHRAGRADHGQTLWSIWMLARWCDTSAAGATVRAADAAAMHARCRRASGPAPPGWSRSARRPEGRVWRSRRRRTELERQVMSTASPRIEPARAADAGVSATELERYSRE